MGVSIEILEIARRKGIVIKEVPVSCRYTQSALDLHAIRHGVSVVLSAFKTHFKNGSLG